MFHSDTVLQNTFLELMVYDTVLYSHFVIVLIRITKKNFNTVFNNRVVSNDVRKIKNKLVALREGASKFIA